MDISKIHTTNASLKFFLITVIIISIMLLSMPAKADLLSYHGSSSLFVVDIGNPNNCGEDTAFAYSQTDNSIVEVTSPKVTTSAGVTVQGVCAAPPTSVNSHIDLGASLRVTGISVYVTANTGRTVVFWGSNTTGTDYQNLGSITTNVAGGWKNFTVSDTTHYRYIGMSDAGAGVNGVNERISEIVILGNALPNITSWSNSYNGTSLIVNPPPGQTVIFSVLAADQPIAGYNWTVNNVNQNKNFSSFSYAFSASSYTVNATVTNAANGTSNNLTWVINGAAASAPTSPYTDVNSIFTTQVSYTNTQDVVVYGSFYPATTTQTDCLFFGFICTDKTINVESTTGYVFISTQGSTSPIKFFSFTPDQYNNYKITFPLDIGTYTAQLWGFAAPGSTCTSGINYDFPLIPLGCYYPHNLTTFTVTNANASQLYLHWNTKLSNNTAIYGETITLAFQPVTSNDYIKIYDASGAVQQSYNVNASTITQIPVFLPLYSIGQWNATIFNGSNVLNNYTAYLNVVPPGAVDVVNNYSITMYWSRAADVVNNPTLLNWNTGSYSGFYNISILLNGEEVRRTQYFGVPGQTQQAVYTFGEQGAYIAQFLDYPNQSIQAQSDIFISAATSSIGGGGTSVNQSGNNLVGSENLIMRLPWIGLMVLIVVVFGLVKNGVQGGAFVFALAITTSIEAVIGLWENWGIYITLLSWLLVGVFFKLNRTIEE